MSVTRGLIAFFMLSSAWPVWALADDAAPAPPAAPSESTEARAPVSARTAANEDSVTPGLTRSAASGLGIITSTVAYNGASEDTALDFNGEIHVWGPFRLVLRVDNVADKARPGIGAAWQFLDGANESTTGSLYFSYKAEGFTEGEGELEAMVALGRQVGPVHGTVNLAYGQDPEARERDGELALGLHVEPMPGLFTGVVGRFRDALGSNGDVGTGIIRDALGAATATYVVGRFGVTASAGVAGVRLLNQDSMRAGVAGALSVGAVF